ncbi:F5/8 type C domain containing protein [Histomonas meleagridis]|uniref:F5/8 type C domain containing protein n=1 Tax=Histomonas meleagridis TaxID=135588 RepID=UPI00355A343A|nr:F5/8 type C domain containing protein [Histomonas meleagridis]KAH0802535.1 F5/8 type C domain containing protein [Histomonas meleagridis]
MITERIISSPQASFKSLQNGPIPTDIVIKNNEEEYKCHSIVASAISPKILEIISSNPQQNVISFEIHDDLHVFPKIIDYFYGNDFNLTSQNCAITYLISSALGIKDLLSASQECLESTFTPDSMIPSLLFIKESNGNIEPHISYICSHFNEMMYREDILSLPFDVLDQILSRDEIEVESEDSLCFWVSKIIQDRGSDFSGLVDRLQLAYLSSDALLSLCSHSCIESHLLIARSKQEKQNPTPKRRLITQVKSVSKYITDDNQLTITLPQNKSIDGIIHYILSHSHTPEIRVEVSSTHYEYFNPQNLLNLDCEHSVWYSKGDAPNQWVMYDFAPRFMKPTAYTLRTSGGSKGEGHLKSWALEASNDGRKWKMIDERKDMLELNGGYNAMSFSCNADEFYRMFRIVQIDFNWRGDYSFVLSCCEFFGQIVPKEISSSK